MSQTTQRISAAHAGTVGVGRYTVNRLGYGAMRITGDGIWGPPADRDESLRVLRRALELDVNFIDTADAYGPEVSEELIAEALHPYPEGLVVGTKAGLVRPGPGHWEPDGSPDHLRQAVEGSLRRLRVDRLQLLQFHRPDPKVPFAESVGTLVELQRQGKIEHIGLCNVGRRQLEEALGLTPIVSVQNRYNLTDRDSEAVVDACQEQGIAFIPWFPLASGRITEAGGALDQVAGRHGASVGQVALAWLLHRAPVMLPIPGTSKVAHLEQNVAAAGLKLDAADMEALERAAA
ncbi:MAG TPA: aldo/keto reductase [Candidatus Dormibacteraeota bacterium]|jgi:aryl-alcohol dehydrogenase-like predicted oxidoreductase|nr:aldo/keto reductase [Candidatus Dormibacteraeota bacterium]